MIYLKIKIKYISVVVFSTLLCITLHLLTPTALTNETPTNTLSTLALSLGMPLTALLWAGIAYSCVALVFYLIEDRIPGEKSRRGLRYGISIAILWLLGYIMCVPVFGNPFINEFVGGLCDAVPVVFLGWMLGLSTTNRGFAGSGNELNKHQTFIGIIIFVITFFLLRIAAYNLQILDTGFRIDPVYTLVWTVVMGICLGITYLLLGKAVKSISPLTSALNFGFLLFGLTWGAFIFFFPLVLKGQLFNTIMIFFIDSMSVTVAYYISEKVFNQSQRFYTEC